MERHVQVWGWVRKERWERGKCLCLPFYVGKERSTLHFASLHMILGRGGGFVTLSRISGEGRHCMVEGILLLLDRQIGFTKSRRSVVSSLGP